MILKNVVVNKWGTRLPALLLDSTPDTTPPRRHTSTDRNIRHRNTTVVVPVRPLSPLRRSRFLLPHITPGHEQVNMYIPVGFVGKVTNNTHESLQQAIQSRDPGALKLL